MVRKRKGFSAKQSRRKSRQMSASTIGTHVQRGSHGRRAANASSMTFRDGRTSARASRSQLDAMAPAATSGEDRTTYRRRVQQVRFAEQARRRASLRRLGVAALVLVAVVAIAVGAGYLAFRGSVGSGLSLKDSDAADALVAVRSGEPYYAVITAELGAVAQPLEQAGPDVVLLARVDREAHSLALVNVPAGLQITVDNSTRRLGDIAAESDAALVRAISTFAKVDVSHVVKIDRDGLLGIVDDLGGVDVDVDQVIDDPRAGTVYIPTGAYTLVGEGALTYLRATNLTFGVQDQLSHQTYFAALLLQKLFSAEGSFVSRVEAIGPHIQTDLTLGELEGLQGWMKDLDLADVPRVVLPGYQTAVTGVDDDPEADSLYVASAADMASIVEALENGEVPDVSDTTSVVPASPGSFTVEVQNGTDIAGAAAVTADALAAQGFRVEAAGNAEQQVYDETLVVYKDDALGPAQANAVIDALGIGRAVAGQTYYKFNTDILLVIGYDYKPVA